ncbi:hypothetical protein QR680_000269 [Steinernema hermaphroditum]|uniref:Uncharacterized protein n=1 Tax=Steinernema hermaphroditum TaxID=289476 RepID=A0AA39GVL7_9BILA|nr:hypothetical protein QR680_000269 [Steinernema hermaphroditum]
MGPLIDLLEVAKSLTGARRRDSDLEDETEVEIPTDILPVQQESRAVQNHDRHPQPIETQNQEPQLIENHDRMNGDSKPTENGYVTNGSDVIVLENGEIVLRNQCTAPAAKKARLNNNQIDVEKYESINNYLTALSHQMNLIMKKLDLKPCACSDCRDSGKRQTSNPRKRSVPTHLPQAGITISMVPGAASQVAGSTRPSSAGSTDSVDVLKIIQDQRADYEKSVEKQMSRSSDGSAPTTSFTSPSVPRVNFTSTPSATATTAQTPNADVITPDFLHTLQQQTHCATVRGRGRGRPMLIGDELHNALVDYLVNYEILHNARLYPSQAIKMATEFIKEKQPGLLADEGGSIVLKMTWAMKLVTHVRARKQKLTDIVNRTMEDISGSVMPADCVDGTNGNATENNDPCNIAMESGPEISKPSLDVNPADMNYAQLMAFLQQTKSQ